MLHRSNVLEHTARVAYLTTKLSESTSLITREAALELAIVHDSEEVITGDIPYLAKVKFPNIKKVVREYFPEHPVTVSSQIVKMADILDVLYEAAVEVQLGSTVPDFAEAPNLVIDMIRSWMDKWKLATGVVNIYNEKKWVINKTYSILKDWSSQFSLISDPFLETVLRIMVSCLLK